MSAEIPEDSPGVLKEMKSNFEVYKSCFVPDCNNTTVKTPKKIFVRLPSNELKHKLWRSAVETPEKKAKKTKYCCEDHFDLKNDLDNYWEWKNQGVSKRLRPNVLPRRSLKFENHSTEVHTPDSKDFAAGDSHSSFIENFISPLETTTISSSSNIKDCGIQHNLEVEHKHCQATVCVYNKKTQTLKLKTNAKLVTIMTEDKCIQCDIECEVSKQLQKATKAIESLQLSVDDLNATNDSIPSDILDSSLSYRPSIEQSSTSSLEKNLKLNLMKENCYENYTKLMIEDDPYLFIGLRKEAMYVLHELHEMSGISLRDLYLVFKKIRLNQSFSILAYEFSMSKSEACRIFQKNVDTVAKYFKQLIVWPSRKNIQINLPIAFRYRFFRVESIIDCFEIEIEKPSDAMYQALSWSDYKGCNTDKRFLSITSDGLINFVSEGVCGRCTDMSIVENCGYLDKIPRSCAVLADRGFKGLDILLQQKKCTLIRPPSVYKDTKCTKQEVRLTKQVASLRIHVERAINRIRNYQILDIHTRVDNKLVKNLDSVVYIVCGLVNLDTPIIKQIDEK
ncbi:hypothetical protein QAD02_002431 [Eretmocerus hayati]|uniref:Uncharacterized protein n=1 Tax=Eretmocerus hayati TaxID=131215 RepID=A0ACC2NLR4_9HYME|nr:hypothetical protein QAD02_002431 [Eretmocerus hayati]